MPKRRLRHATSKKSQPGAFWRGLVWIARHPQPVVALVIVIGSIGGVWHLVTRSEAFTVTTIQTPPDSSVQVPSSVIGQNLWVVDVQTLAQQLKNQYPQAKRIRVLRQPPHTLRIDIQERFPLAQVHLGKWYQVASDGYILPDGQPKPWDQLTTIKGAGDPNAPLKPGRDNASPRLQQALRLAKILRRVEILKGKQIAVIDVSRESELLFVLEGGLEVRCGSEAELAAQLKRLPAVLAVVHRNQMAVRYVDVRFQDPVIGPQAS